MIRSLCDSSDCGTRPFSLGCDSFGLPGNYLAAPPGGRGTLIDSDISLVGRRIEDSRFRRDMQAAKDPASIHMLQCGVGEQHELTDGQRQDHQRADDQQQIIARRSSVNRDEHQETSDYRKQCKRGEEGQPQPVFFLVVRSHVGRSLSRTEAPRIMLHNCGTSVRLLVASHDPVLQAPRLGWLADAALAASGIRRGRALARV